MSLLVFFLFVLPAVPVLRAQGPAFGGEVAPAEPAQAVPTIDRIDFEGNRRIRSETLRARIFTRPGDTYNPDALRRDFQALWNTQYFDDIRLEVQDSPTRPNSKIVIFHVVERPVIRRIEYKGLKSISESDVLDRYKDNKVGLSVEGQFDPTKVMKAVVAIKDLESEHGHQFATVKPTYEKIPATSAVKLTFTVAEGPKVKVGLISFTGNTVFSQARLRRSMRHDRPYAIPLWLFSVPVFPKTFDRAKLNEDLEIGVRGMYQNNGYMKVVVKEPVLKTVDVDRRGVPIPLPGIGREHGKATNITIAIEEGLQYRMGRLVIRSADPDKGLSLKRDYLESIFPIKKGEIFDVDKVRKAIDNYTKIYGVYGYIDFTATPETDFHDDTKTIDLTFDFDEQKQFYVRRIEFSGNTTTRDKVIRRELLINEGDIFNNRSWELSLLRLNQLNYFDAIKPENAEIKRNTQQGSVDILLKLKEKGKQSISFNGGVSGLAGSFIGATYQTNNFLGLGETLTLSAQYGNIMTNAVFGFTEPYLFDRPISAGFTISASRFNFNQSQQESVLLGQSVQLSPSIEQDYTQDTTGFTLFASYPIRKFSFTRLGLTYGYSVTGLVPYSTASTDLFEALQYQSLAGPSSLTGIRASSFTPSLTYNTVDNPLNPKHGKSVFYSFSFEGAGGNVRALINTVQAKYFRPTYHNRNTLAFHLLASFATGWGGLELPPFSRLYLGGENDLRGFDIRTVTPIVFIPVETSRTITIPTSPNATAVTVPELNYQISFPGGDTSGVFNFEYRIPIVGPVAMDLFTDVGTVGILRKDQLQLSSTNYTNLASQFPAGYQFSSTMAPNAPIANQLQIMNGTNFKLRSSAGIEFVVQIPVINAPFRLYWAYNFTRLDEQIVAPTGSFQSALLANIYKLSCGGASPPPPGGPPGQPCPIFNAVVLPQLQTDLVNQQRINFFEPITTFRFAVSRTF